MAEKESLYYMEVKKFEEEGGKTVKLVSSMSNIGNMVCYCQKWYENIDKDDNPYNRTVSFEG